MALISGSGLTLFFGQMEIFSSLDIEVADKAKIGIIGPNGSGKTSLLRIITGEQDPYAGSVSRARGIRIGYVPQVPTLVTGGTLHDEIMMAFDDLLRLGTEMEDAATALGSANADEATKAAARYAALAHDFEDRGGYTYQNTMERTVSGLGLSADSLKTPAASASGGERTRAALAKALLANPDLLVLDEPTNHLDLAGLAWLERFLSRFRHSFIVVSHDRYFLDRVTAQTWEMEDGKLRAFPGNYSRSRILKAEQDLQHQRDFDRQQKYIAKEQEFIRRYGAGQRAQEAQGRETRLHRLERVEAPTRVAEISLAPMAASRTAHIVLRTKGVQVGFVDGEERTPMLGVPNLEVHRGARVAIMGDNGAGKTTLLKTLLGLLPPLEGSVTLGGNVRAGYYRQGLDDLPESSSVLDALLQVKGMSPAEGRSFLARFLFRGDDVFQVVSTLSGGQRSRLSLARLVATQPNLLVLDEPTNHLDIPSREALEQVLLGYDGTLIFVSHDRQLVSLLAKQLWLVTSGTVEIFPGSFEEWMREKEAPPPPPIPKPKGPSRTPPRPPTAQKKAAGPPVQDPEQVIAEMEKKLGEIEQELQLACEQQDASAISRLGEDHQRMRALLDEKWAEWAG